MAELQSAGERVGVLLINLGSPDAPTPKAIRRYLDQFLSDPRVVEMPRPLWQIILKLFILPRRPKKVAPLYARIWDRAENDNPLQVTARAQVAALAAALPGVRVRYALRYGAPSIASALDTFRAEGVGRVLLAPLYPQYGSATTGTALAEAFRVFSGWRHLPAVRTLPPYFDDPAYIDAVGATIRRTIAAEHPERIVLSFHGLPEAAVARGDPYARHCERTADLLRAALGMDAAQMPHAYQSRFGRAEWLKPDTVGLLERLAAQGVRRVAVACPGFAADCIETMDEIGIRARESFRAAGGAELTLVPCLNAGPDGRAMLLDLVRRSLAGWGDLP